MKTFDELTRVADIHAAEVRLLHPGVCVIVITWNKDSPSTGVALRGEIEPQRDIPRFFRELADKYEATGQLLVRSVL